MTDEEFEELKTKYTKELGIMKKVGDLTLKEILKYHETHKCKDCKLNLTGLCQIACIIKCEVIGDARYLEQEIKIEECQKN